MIYFYYYNLKMINLKIYKYVIKYFFNLKKK